MSRNGVPSFLPSLTIRTRPARSTTKRRWTSPRGAVTKMGALNVPTRRSLTPLAAFTTVGEVVDRAAGAELALGPFPHPPHPASATTERASTAAAGRGGTQAGWHEPIQQRGL